MGDISFGVSPIRDHAFFKQPKLDSLLGHDFLQRPSLAAQAFDLIRGRRPRRIPSQSALASFQKLFRPDVIQRLGYAFAPT